MPDSRQKEQNEERMDRLVTKAAEIVATGMQRKYPITTPRDYPPCFDSQKQYADWLEANAGYSPRERPDFPKEPNYCRDCSQAYKDRMVAENRCIFPEIIFKQVRDVEGEEETVGFMKKADRV